MGEVAEMFDVNATLIRFWESKFDILKPHKNKKGNRLFTPQDVDNLRLIYHLVKEEGMTLSGAQKRIKQIKKNPEGVSRDLEVIERLQRIRAVLMEIREELKSDGSEVYHEDELGEENTMAEVRPVKPGQKARAVAPVVPEAGLQVEEEWVEDELVALDGLDGNIAELAKEDNITPAEADELLEDAEPLSLSGDAEGDMPAMRNGSAEGFEDDIIAAPQEITGEELEMLDYEPEQPDYPEELSDERPPFEEQSLFADHEVPAAPSAPAEEPAKPRIVEQTLF